MRFFNTGQNTNAAMKPCLPLKYLVDPKRSFHASFFVLVVRFTLELVFGFFWFFSLIHLQLGKKVFRTCVFCWMEDECGRMCMCNCSVMQWKAL